MLLNAANTGTQLLFSSRKKGTAQKKWWVTLQKFLNVQEVPRDPVHSFVCVCEVKTHGAVISKKEAS